MSAKGARDHARKQGRQTYSTGIPCKHGHIAPRKTTSGQCTACYALLVARPGYKAHRREQMKDYNAKDFRKAQNRASHLRLRYGLTSEAYSRLLASQGGACGICRTKKLPARGTFYVDHCHGTGKIRGLLCHQCNTGIGHMRDSVELLRAAIDYLESPK